MPLKQPNQTIFINLISKKVPPKYYYTPTEATHYKKAAVQPHTSHLTNHSRVMSKTCWACKDELISDVLPWTPTYGHTSVGRLKKRAFVSSVQTMDPVKRTYQERYSIETDGEKESIYFDDDNDECNII